MQVIKAREPWYYKDAAGLKQVAGFVKKFKQITLTTVRVSTFTLVKLKSHCFL